MWSNCVLCCLFFSHLHTVLAGALILSQEHQPHPFISKYKQSRLCLMLEAAMVSFAC